MRVVTKEIRRIPGAILFLEMLRRFYLQTNQDVLIGDFDGNIKLRVTLNEHIGSQIFWYGSYNRDILIVLNKILRAGMVFLDLGANIGEIALYAAKHVGLTGNVYAFEPVPTLAQRLRSNAELNGFHRLGVVEQGVGSHAGTYPIFMEGRPFSDGLTNYGLASFYQTDKSAQCLGEVEVTTLDAWTQEEQLKRVDVIKVDIEGGELQALQGGKDLIERLRPILIIEVQKETCKAAGYDQADILDFLEPFRYRFEKIGRKGRLKRVTAETLGDYQNILCTPQGASVSRRWPV